MATPLSDLDELVLRCRDDKTKALISEAVSSYRGGAFRSAIVATWVAVCFDIMEKIRELAIAGDRKAEQLAAEIETIRASSDLRRALTFERTLLAVARDDFELLSPIQFVDLERLQADRNRCAHPSLIAEETNYQPAAELARLHIHSAVEHLLRHPPVQGKYALARLQAAIESEYFPVKVSDAVSSLSAGPLRRPKDSLVRNIIIVLAKRLFSDLPPDAERRLFSALGAIAELHGALYEATLQEKLSTIVRGIEDNELGNAVWVVSKMPRSWNTLEVDVVHRLQNYVLNLPAGNFGLLEMLDGFSPLTPSVAARSRRATRSELSDTFFVDLPEPIGDRFISLYLTSSSFDAANSWARELLVYRSDYTEAQIRTLITGAASNGEVLGSFRLSDVIQAFRASEKIPPSEFEQLLRDNGLSEFSEQDSADNGEDIE